MNEFDKIRLLIKQLRRAFDVHLDVLKQAIDRVEEAANSLEEAEK